MHVDINVLYISVSNLLIQNLILLQAPVIAVVNVLKG